jgi:hypothetical protein
MSIPTILKRAKIFPVLAVGLALVACNPVSTISTAVGRIVPPSITAPATGSSGAAPANAGQAAIQQVITQANAEQAQAVASGNPSVMSDTATTAYYQDLVQTNNALASDGVTGIKLSNIQWGAVSVQGTQATATTTETWITTYRDGTTLQSTDENDYTLTQSNGAWKISADDHPDNGSQPSPSTPGNPAPGTASTVPQDSSRNWAGYAAESGNYTAVSGTWTVPQPSGSSGVGATWVGVGGVSSTDLIQAGTQETVEGNGRVQYSAWIELLPQASQQVPLTVEPGDSVTVSIAEQQTGSWLITMTDATTGQKLQRTVSYSSTNSSVEWVEEAPSGDRSILPLENFGTVTFTNGSATLNGKTVTIGGAGAQPVTMMSSTRQALAVPSKLTSNGASFSVSRTSTPATVPVTTTGPGRRIG